MSRLKAWIDWRAALLLVIVALPFNLWLFPARSRYLQAQSGASSPILDTWFGYPPDRAFTLIGALGKDGRQLYALTEVTVDLLYPLIYTGLLAVLLGLLTPLAFPGSRLAAGLARLPLVVLVSDYLENIGVVTLLLVYPSQPALIARLTAAMTMLKISLGVLCVVVIVVSGGKIIFERFFGLPARGGTDDR